MKSDAFSSYVCAKRGVCFFIYYTTFFQLLQLCTCRLVPLFTLQSRHSLSTLYWLFTTLAIFALSSGIWDNRNVSDRYTLFMIAVESIRILVAPVVMISAQALICLPLYNRLAVVVGRLRGFSREHFEAQIHLHKIPAEQSDNILTQALKTRAIALDAQNADIFRRAGLLRNALILLQSAVLAMLLCIMLLGLSLVFPGMETWSLVPFFFGVVATAGGLLLSIRELIIALDSAKLESEKMPSSEVL